MTTELPPPADASETQRIRWRRNVQQQARVRLLIAMPVVMVLLLTLMSGAMFHLVEQHFESVTLLEGGMQDFAQKWLVLLVVFDLVGAGVGFYLAYSITGPIRTLIQITEKVAIGDFSEKAEIIRQDEVGELGQTFNNMIDSLNRSITMRNRFVLESFSGGLITTDLTGTITAVNSAAEKMLRIDADTVVGRSTRDVLNTPDAAQLLAFIEEALWKKRPIVGRNLTVDVQGRQCLLSANSSVMKDGDGSVFGLLINFRDVAELRKFYEQMNRADRLATIGTFATGLAHEVRNPLGAIKGTAQLLAEDVKSSPHALEYTKIIVKEVNRLDSIVREVQEFSTPMSTPRKWLDLNALVKEAVLIARSDPKAQLKPGVELREQYGELSRTYLSADKITQALLNILINAFQATPENHEVRVETEFLAGESLPFQISIINTGSTIRSSELGKIFEPFFTTKDTGTGLGLSIAYQVISVQGGEIHVQSDNDSVIFTIRLPLQHPEDEVTL